MTVNNDSTSRISGTANQWYSSAISTAIVGAIFSLIILVLLVSNFIHSSIVQARREQELVNQKIKIQKRPDDEQLLTQVRESGSACTANQAGESELKAVRVKTHLPGGSFFRYPRGA